MVEKTDEVRLELTYAELFEVVNALLGRAQKLISMKAPQQMVLITLSRAEKLNDILVKGDYDCWTAEMFEGLKKQVNEK